MRDSTRLLLGAPAAALGLLLIATSLAGAAPLGTAHVPLGHPRIRIPPPPEDQPLDFDVIVYGATPAGISAAVAAANAGQYTVGLFEPLAMIGGMGAAGGLGLNDQQMRNLTAVTGLARVWAQLNFKHYGANGTAGTNMVEHPDMFVGAASFHAMLDNASSVTTMLGCRITAAARNGAQSVCVQSISLLCDGGEARTAHARVFVDASYDADLVVLAGGIDVAHWREARGVYNETLAGVIRLDEPLESFDHVNVSATFDNGTVVPYVNPDPMPPEGTGDDTLMAFQHRACITPDAHNKVAIQAPPGYDRRDFVLLQRQIEAVVASGKYPHGPPLNYWTDLGHYSEAVFASGRNKYTICCGTGPVDSDQPSLNAGWATANHTERMRIFDAHAYYTVGSLYYMAHDEAVPKATRDDASQYGWCADEFENFGHFPPQLYVRISNRLVGDYVLTQNNLAAPRSKADSVSMGVWEFDQHTMTRHAVPYTHVDPTTGASSAQLRAINEGFFRHALTASREDVGAGDGGASGANVGTAASLWYDVPYRAMLPKRAQASNVLVPVALSASSVAFSSTRIETMYMDVGTAAGVAARLTLDSESRVAPASRALGAGRLPSCPTLAVQDVNVTEVQRLLTDQYGQRVHGPWW